jgi:hypothetical protein
MGEGNVGMLRRKGWELKSEPIILKEEVNDNGADAGHAALSELHFSR